MLEVEEGCMLKSVIYLVILNRAAARKKSAPLARTKKEDILIKIQRRLLIKII